LNKEPAMKTHSLLIALVAAVPLTAVAFLGCSGDDTGKALKQDQAQVRPSPPPRPEPAPAPEPRPVVPRPGPTDTGDPGPPRPPN
jgi:hypothetical protein